MKTSDEVIGWLIDQAPSARKKSLSQHPEALDHLLHAARKRLASISPLGLAATIDEKHRTLPHLDYLDAKLAKAVKRVENGETVFLRISMPPRSGKSVTTSEYLPLWILSQHPDWKIGLISHAPALAAGWGRQIRRMVEDTSLDLGLELAPDAGSVTDWETTKRGGVSSRSVGQSITGRGFKVMIVDDAVKDYADAASETKREALRNWWTTTARTRLEPPGLVVVIGTRWHEDDFTGWVDTTGDPFEVIELRAIATEDDAIGRKPGDPLYSPFITETREQAIARWKALELSVGAYAWSALYQQSPHPAGGTIFKRSHWRYWTRNPDLVTGNIRLFLPEEAVNCTWVDSWDIASSEKKTADYSVGQRWARELDGSTFLIGQSRTQTEFVETLAILRSWAEPGSLDGTGVHVRKRLVEAASDGRAIISTLRREVPGIHGINPVGPKEVRARAITPAIERGEVYLPNPEEPGNEWVHGLLEELDAFPTGKHDDQVDALTQVLLNFQASSPGTLHIPSSGWQPTPIATSPRAARRSGPPMQSWRA